MLSGKVLDGGQVLEDLIFNIVDLAKVEDEVISVDFVAIFEVGTADICVKGVWEEVMWGALWDR